MQNNHGMHFCETWMRTGLDQEKPSSTSGVDLDK